MTPKVKKLAKKLKKAKAEVRQAKAVFKKADEEYGAAVWDHDAAVTKCDVSLQKLSYDFRKKEGFYPKTPDRTKAHKTLDELYDRYVEGMTLYGRVQETRQRHDAAYKALSKAESRLDSFENELYRARKAASETAR